MTKRELVERMKDMPDDAPVLWGRTGDQVHGVSFESGAIMLTHFDKVSKSV